MFTAEIYMHHFLLSIPVCTLNPEEADWFYTPVYTTCDLTPNGLPLPFKSPRMMRSAIQLISSNWLYWNRTEGADHFFIIPHDFGACFHYQEEKAIERGSLHMLQMATLVQTFGQRNHVCLKDGSVIIPPFSPPHKMQAHLIPPSIPRSIFVYFRGLFYDVGNDQKVVIMQADDIVLPFADAIPWEDIGVFIEEKDVPKLDTILSSIPMGEILRKQRLLANPSMKQAMLFPQPAQARDDFHQILNGLARKLPHGRGVFLKAGERVLNWTAGPVGDLKPCYIYSDKTPFEKLPDKYSCPVCGAPKRRFKPYEPSVTKNANDTDVRKARKAQIKRDEAVGQALPFAIAIGAAALAGLYFYLNSTY